MTDEPEETRRSEPLVTDEPKTSSGGAVFWEGLRASMGRTPVWLLTWSVMLLLALPVVLPWFNWYEGALANRTEPGSQIARLDQNFRIDYRTVMASLDDATARTGVILAFVAMLCGVFFAGGWLQIFLERTSGHSLRRFFYGGSRYFFRFFRFMILTLLALSLWSWVCYELPWQELVLNKWLGVPASDYDALETLDSEWTVVKLRWAQEGLYLLLIGLTLVWGTFARARMALHDARSAVWNGLCALYLILRHPLRTLRPMLMILFTQVVVLAIAIGMKTWIERGLDQDSSWLRILALFATTQVLPLLWASIARGARYCAAVRVLRDLSRSASPDPWTSSIGGPGGPRYPLGGDEYGVSL